MRGDPRERPSTRGRRLAEQTRAATLEHATTESLALELLDAIIATETADAYWSMQALATKLDLYLDDLGDKRAWRAIATAIRARTP